MLDDLLVPGLVLRSSGHRQQGDETELRTIVATASGAARAFRFSYNNELAHLTEAGADIFLMPSKYEPCGLNQMYSMRYGTVPVVRATGGLADTVQEFDPVNRRGDGFRFQEVQSGGIQARPSGAPSVCGANRTPGARSW